MEQIENIINDTKYIYKNYTMKITTSKQFSQMVKNASFNKDLSHNIYILEVYKLNIEIQTYLMYFHRLNDVITPELCIMYNGNKYMMFRNTMIDRLAIIDFLNLTEIVKCDICSKANEQIDKCLNCHLKVCLNCSLKRENNNCFKCGNKTTIDVESKYCTQYKNKFVYKI